MWQEEDKYPWLRAADTESTGVQTSRQIDTANETDYLLLAEHQALQVLTVTSVSATECRFAPAAFWNIDQMRSSGLEGCSRRMLPPGSRQTDAVLTRPPVSEGTPQSVSLHWTSS